MQTTYFHYIVHFVKSTNHARIFYASFIKIELRREFREKKTVTSERKCIFVKIQTIESSDFARSFFAIIASSLHFPTLGSQVEQSF